MNEKEKRRFRHFMEHRFAGLMRDAKRGDKNKFNSDCDKIYGAVFCMRFIGMISEETDDKIFKLIDLIRYKYEMPWC